MHVRQTILTTKHQNKFGDLVPAAEPQGGGGTARVELSSLVPAVKDTREEKQQRQRTSSWNNFFIGQRARALLFSGF